MEANSIKNLFDLSIKRTGKQAFVWYIIYSIILFAITLVVLGIIYILKVHIKVGHEITTQIMLYFKMFIIGLLSLDTYLKKNLRHNIKALSLMSLAMLTTFTLGGHLSLFFVAILTTFDNKTISDK